MGMETQEIKQKVKYPREEINGRRRNEKRKIKNSPTTLWVSSPWVSITKKKGCGDEKNEVKVGVFVVCRWSFVTGGILKKESE
uniref:Uncharacterized protein n=1 Tax=Cucumis melo TaxID=3656 RepID=A0A9I9E2X3_CUCME